MLISERTLHHLITIMVKLVTSLLTWVLELLRMVEISDIKMMVIN